MTAPYAFSVDGYGDDDFRVLSVRGREKMSSVYWFRLVVTAASKDDEVERVALGQKAALTWTIGNSVRAFYGLVSAVGVIGLLDERLVKYEVQFVPRMWLLKRKRKSRIFQQMRVPDIVTQVLLDAGIAARWQLSRDYPIREYCTQYEETDYEFVSRLCAEAGIYFHFAQGGPVDSAKRTASATAAAAGGVAATAVASFAGSAAGALVSSIASDASPLLPGDTVLFGDDSAFYPKVGTAGAAPPLHFVSVGGTHASRLDRVLRFELRTSVRATAAAFRDYDPERPLSLLESRALSVAPFASNGLDALADVATTAGGALGAVLPSGIAGSIASGVAGNAGVAANALETIFGDHPPPYLEVYDHHAPFLFPKWTIGGDEAKRMLRQSRRRAVIAKGESGCPQLGAGHVFALVDHPISRLDETYVVTAVEHRGRVAMDGSGSSTYEVYENSFECAPASMTFVPPRPKRRNVQVPVTAVVAGPKDTEIHVDAMGQIKVQFHWDRDGKTDDKSSCWIRSMQAWSGAAWGAQFIPRVGMEVIVIFEGGDPDKPIVSGTLYNATHPSPFLLPHDKTRSGFRTQTSPLGPPGSKHGYNELSFQDALGSEQVFVHAQKDFDAVVGHNQTVRVENDQHVVVSGKRVDEVRLGVEERVHGDRSSYVDGNRLEATSGNRDERVTGMAVVRVEGRERREVQGPADHVFEGDHTVRVLGCSTTIVGKNDKKKSWTTHAEGVASLSGLDKLELSSSTELVLSVGDTSIRLTKTGIELSASSVTTKGDGGKLAITKDGITARAKDTQLSMSDKLVMKSPASTLQMGQEMKLDGTKILLNSPDRATDAPPEPPDPPTTLGVKDQDGSPICYQRFVVHMDDGSSLAGKTDKDGQASLELTGGGKVVFPDLTMRGEPPQGSAVPYVVRQGDYLARLAFTFGFSADDAWNDPMNADLKASRKDPNILHPGDIVYFPKAPKQGLPIEKSTSNSYSVDVPKTPLNLQFNDPRLKSAKYRVEGLGSAGTGTTANGALKLQVPVHLREVKIIFDQLNIVCSVAIGDLDPITETTGYRRRLEHLGYRRVADASDSEDEAKVLDQLAIEAFQVARGLARSGVLDDATRATLLAVHGS